MEQHQDIKKSYTTMLAESKQFVAESIGPKDVMAITFDFKDIDACIEQFIKAIETVFKGSVHEIPSMAGSDTFGFFVAKKKMSPDDIAEYDDAG